MKKFHVPFILATCMTLAAASVSHGQDAALDALAPAPGDALAEGPMHVPEPAVKRWVATGTIACFLVPGLAFDHQGGRIGHGAGFYDRLLATRAPESLCVAIGYDWQLVDDDLPQSAHDVRMDWIITPERTVRAGGDSARENPGNLL